MSRPDCHSGPTATFHHFESLIRTMALTYTEADLELALTDLAKQDTPNYSAASKKYGVPSRTLSNWFAGKSVSR